MLTVLARSDLANEKVGAVPQFPGSPKVLRALLAASATHTCIIFIA